MPYLANGGKEMKKFSNNDVWLIKDSETKKVIAFEYHFANGEVKRMDYDPNEEWCQLLAEDIKKEDSADRLARIHTGVYLDSFEDEYNGEGIIDNATPDFLYDQKEEQERVDAFVDSLPFLQKQICKILLEDNKVSLREIARRLGRSHVTIAESFNALKPKILTFLNLIPNK